MTMTTQAMTTNGTPKPSRLALGRTGLPNRVHRRILAFRVTVEKLVADAHGGVVDALAAKRIATAVLAYTEAVRSQKRLADAADGKIILSEAELQGWSDRVVRHHAACDRILSRDLGLDGKAEADPVASARANFNRTMALRAQQTVLAPAVPGDRPAAGQLDGQACDPGSETIAATGNADLNPHAAGPAGDRPGAGGGGFDADADAGDDRHAGGGAGEVAG